MTLARPHAGLLVFLALSVVTHTVLLLALPGIVGRKSARVDVLE